MKKLENWKRFIKKLCKIVERFFKTWNFSWKIVANFVVFATKKYVDIPFSNTYSNFFVYTTKKKIIKIQNLTIFTSIFSEFYESWLVNWKYWLQWVDKKRCFWKTFNFFSRNLTQMRTIFCQKTEINGYLHRARFNLTISPCQKPYTLGENNPEW